MNPIKKSVEVGGRALDHAQITFYQLVRIPLGCGLVLIIASLLNIFGLQSLNFYLAFFFFIATAIAVLNPRILALVLGGGAIVGWLDSDKTIFKGMEMSLSAYLSLIKNILLWESVLLFFLSTKSFEENPQMLIAMASAYVLIAGMSSVWNIGKGISKKLAYLYVLVMLAFFSFMSVPSTFWVATIGFDPLGKIGLSQLDFKIAEVRNERRNQLESIELARLNSLLDKVKRGDALSKEEEKYLADLKSKNDPQILKKKPQRIELNCKKMLAGVVEFFTPDGMPNVWYYQNDTGEYEWFNAPGRHQFLNEPLTPIEPRIIRQQISACKSEDAHRKNLENSKQKIDQELFEEQIAFNLDQPWSPDPIWGRYLENERVAIEYSSNRFTDAAMIASRLIRLGANVDYKRKILEAGGVGMNEIIYPFSDFEAATVIQASASDVVYFTLTSSGGSGAMTVRIF